VKKQRVRLRPKARRKTASRLGRVLAVGLAAACVVVVVKVRPWRAVRLPALESVALARGARVDSLVVSGAPEPLAGEVLAAVGWEPGQVWGPWAPRRVAEELKSRFSCLSEVRPERSWRAHSVRLAVELRRAVALTRGAGGGGFLAGDGTVFSAPPGVVPEQGLPVVELPAGGKEADMRRLAAFIGASGGEAGFPSPLVRAAFAGGDAGWSAELADGTILQWGDLRWTRQKMGRLKEVLTDASAKFGGKLAADLRHFEDGKILIKAR